MSAEVLYVVKRDGKRASVRLDKITDRIAKLTTVNWALNEKVDPAAVATKVCTGIYPGVTTAELDKLAAETAANLVTVHPDYSYLAARLEISSLHKSTKPGFFDVVHDLYHYVNPRTGKAGPLISDEVFKIVEENKEKLEAAVDTDRDYNYDYFGVKTLQRAYLLKINGSIAERPNHMLMRVSLGIHKTDLEKAIETYDMMSNLIFTHASPTMFNAGTPRPQMSSCFLLTMSDDSIEGIYDTLKQCAAISKNAGGIGLSVHKIRAGGSYIRGTNGTSNGLVPMLRVFNNTARYVDQGGGKRKGSFAIYLEPWHADVQQWLELKKNHGKEEDRARDLFYALWIPDLFMSRVEQDADWTLMCPNECPGLADVHGEKFNKLYLQYEADKKGHKTIKARALWKEILATQQETGTPYMLYKDSCNSKSNQQNLGTIRSSNLCTEILEYTSPDEVAVCNLASIALPKFVKTGADGKKFYDFNYLKQITKVATVNLNRVIDANYYPVEEARVSNMRHRPIGIGVQGLADTFMLLKLPFDSPEAKQLNEDIFATIYYGAVEASTELAEAEGTYETYGPSEDGTREGCPAFHGKLQFDMWDAWDPKTNKRTGGSVQPTTAGGVLDWDALRAKVKEHGLRNSLLLAPMPTASTSQILGNNECFEPYTSNVYVRRTLAGEFIVINKHLLNDLIERGLWTDLLKQQLIAANGSVQQLPIPQDLKDLYKTVWEISAKTQINMAGDRGAYICQSQSFNVHMAGVSYSKLTSMHFFAWKRGLKTGMYYLRSKPAVDAIKFTLDQKQLAKAEEDAKTKLKASAALREETECLNCGS